MSRESALYDRRQRLFLRFTIPTAPNRTDSATVPAVDAAGAGIGTSQTVLPTHSGNWLHTEQLCAGCPCARPEHSAQPMSPTPHTMSLGLSWQAQQKPCGGGGAAQSVLPIHSRNVSQIEQLCAGWPPPLMHFVQFVSVGPHSILPPPKSQAQHCWPTAGAGVPNQSTATATRATVQTRAFIVRLPAVLLSADFAMTVPGLPTSAQPTSPEGLSTDATV